MPEYRETTAVSTPHRIECLVNGKPVVWATGRGWSDGWFLRIDQAVGKTLGLNPHDCLISMNNIECAKNWVKFLGRAIEIMMVDSREETG